MPAARQRSSSPFMASALTAMIGVRAAITIGFGRAQPPRQFVTVHLRHVNIGEHGGIATGCPRRHRFDAVGRSIGDNPQQFELEHEHLAIHGVIVDDEDALA